MKRIISLLLCLLIVCAPVFASSEDVTVLLYHNVTDRHIIDGELMHISPAMLEEHFKCLAESGYSVISMNEYYAHCTQGTPIPEKSVIITFDDGYISNYEYAYPLLKKYDFKATFYVITNAMGASNIEYPHFSWAQAIEMESSGHVQIESHSATHADFSTLSYEQAVWEMRLSKYAIESNMNKECRFFAYPYGATSNISAAVASSAPYAMASIVSNTGFANHNHDNFRISRHTVSGNWSGYQLIKYIESITK